MNTTKDIRKLITLLIIFAYIKGYAQNKPADFIPDGYVLFDKYYGDLNKDSIEDCLLFIKATDKSKIFMHEYRGELDQNRRGIIMLLKKGNKYEVAAENHTCFESEDEDGGVYYAPELDISINKGNIYFNYLHGRYGSWTYTFRYQNNDLELIGYDSSYRSDLISDYVTFDDTSINFLSKKKLIKEVN